MKAADDANDRKEEPYESYTKYSGVDIQYFEDIVQSTFLPVLAS